MTRKKKFWDRRRNHLCAVCGEDVPFEEYFQLVVEKYNLIVHKEDCKDMAFENPEILKDALENL